MIKKNCLYCHTSFEVNSKYVNKKFCDKSCAYRYEQLKKKITDLYAYNDPKQYSDAILQLIKEGKNYHFRSLEND